MRQLLGCPAQDSADDARGGGAGGRLVWRGARREGDDAGREPRRTASDRERRLHHLAIEEDGRGLRAGWKRRALHVRPTAVRPR